MLKKILATSLIILQILTPSASAFEFHPIIQPIVVQPLQVSSAVLKNKTPCSVESAFLFFKAADSFVNQPLVVDQGLSFYSHVGANKKLSNPAGWRLTGAYHANLPALIDLNGNRGNPSSNSSPLSSTKDGILLGINSGCHLCSSLRSSISDAVIDDDGGRREQLIYPSSKTINYTYDDNSNLDLVKIGSTTLADYDYDFLNRRSAKTFTYPTTDQGAVYSFDIGNQLTSIANKILPSTNIATYAYTSFDAVGNRTQMQRTYTTGSAVSTNYTYNDIYELTGTSGAQSHSYTYDSVGNRDVADSVTYTPNSLNQYTAVGSATYTNSSNGNITSDGTSTFGYDAENRLVSFDTTGTSNDATYDYDALGRRVKKTVNSTATYFVYDGGDVIADYSSSSLLREYIHGGAIDEILAMDTGSGLYYYHYDGLGSVTEVTDDSGTIAENYTYDPYGIPSVTTSSINNRYRFTGREYDEESGLYHYRRRYYDPLIGRFLQRDPINPYLNFIDYSNKYPKPINEVNAYLYTGNNPINRIDPLGLWYIDINFSGGTPWGLGGTTGFLIGPGGVYFYAGPGVATPGPGGSISWSPDDISTGWNQGPQLAAGPAYSVGKDKDGNYYQERGLGTPGAGYFWYYVFDPLRWPWIPEEDPCEGGK